MKTRSTSIKMVLRITSFFVALIFSFNTIASSAPASLPSVQPAASFQNFEIPDSLGSVESRFSPAGIEGPAVIHIQDAHAQPEAQRHIQELLSYLAKRYGVKKVALEAAFGRLSLGGVRFYPLEKAHQAAVDRLAGEGELTGAELYALGLPEPKAKLVGVEDETLYRESLKLFRQVKSSKDEIQETLSSYQREIDLIETSILNRDLFSFLIQKRSWDGQKDDASQYFDVLEKLSRSRLDLDLGNPRAQFEWPALSRLMKLRQAEASFKPELALRDLSLLKESFGRLPKTERRAFVMKGLELLSQHSHSPPLF